MIPIVTDIAFILLGLAATMVVVRIIRGPTLPDRILGLDMLSLLGIGAIGAFALRTGLYLYLDLAIALALVAFVATIAFARYLISRGRHP
jgi:multicomponent Na+:H+ antiporter subunit F